MTYSFITQKMIKIRENYESPLIAISFWIINFAYKRIKIIFGMDLMGFRKIPKDILTVLIDSDLWTQSTEDDFVTGVTWYNPHLFSYTYHYDVISRN